jgi:hypothetical protein
VHLGIGEGRGEGLRTGMEGRAREQMLRTCIYLCIWKGGTRERRLRTGMEGRAAAYR